MTAIACAAKFVEIHVVLCPGDQSDGALLLHRVDPTLPEMLQDPHGPTKSEAGLSERQLLLFQCNDDRGVVRWLWLRSWSSINLA